MSNKKASRRVNDPCRKTIARGTMGVSVRAFKQEGMEENLMTEDGRLRYICKQESWDVVRPNYGFDDLKKDDRSSFAVKSYLHATAHEGCSKYLDHLEI